MPDYHSKLRLEIPPVVAEDVLHGFAVVRDELRSMAATFDEVSKAMSRLGTACLEVQADYLKTLDTACRPTCQLCCHYQAHPPRCQLSKRPISPKQFSCKKYSPKHNSRK